MNETQVTEAYVQGLLWKWLNLQTHRIVVPNAYYFNRQSWESDLVSITKSKRAWEFEIKLSRADFLRDFKKTRHRIYSRDAWIGAYNFYYVIHGFEVDLSELPNYAGLMVVEYEGDPFNSHYIKTIKGAPRRSKTPKATAKDIEDLAVKLMYRYWNKIALGEKGNE